LLARELVDIHEQHIWRFLRAQKIDLSGRKSWCQSSDPEFVPKAADIVGLYVAPPTSAVVLSVGEKPSIQALERAQGYLKLPIGLAMVGQSHDYKRHGTSTLFAAFKVGTGQVVGKHYKRRRRLEFRDFMNWAVKQYEGKEIHVVLDNLSTHKPVPSELDDAALERKLFTPSGVVAAETLRPRPDWVRIHAEMRSASVTPLGNTDGFGLLAQHKNVPV
jgi:hypothetical protein